MDTALITGASRGLGRALTTELLHLGWTVVATARSEEDLHDLARAAQAGERLVVVAGDVRDELHRLELASIAESLGGLDLLVNNAGMLGPSPQPELATYPLDVLREVLDVNVVAPLALVQGLLPQLGLAGGAVVNLTSDAAVEAYAGWGGYGASKAALDQMSAVLAAELPQLRIYAFDPGDMRTDMHQAAFPGEDISDRPEPATVVPALLALLDAQPPSGRYRAGDVPASAGRVHAGEIR